MKPPVRVLLVLCIVALSLGLSTGAVAAAEADDRPADGQLVIELDTNGDADVVFTDEFDLTDPQQRALFEDLRESEEFRRAAAGQVRGGMQSVSERVAEDLDRELVIGEVTAETTVDGETGTVAYGFRWENLAALEGERIVLSEPFSTYTSLDRELVVVAPDGYELASVSPEPSRQDDAVARWPGLTEFGDGFEVVAAPAETHGDGSIAIGTAALLLSTLFLGRER